MWRPSLWYFLACPWNWLTAALYPHLQSDQYVVLGELLHAPHLRALNNRLRPFRVLAGGSSRLNVHRVADVRQRNAAASVSPFNADMIQPFLRLPATLAVAVRRCNHPVRVARPARSAATV